MHLYDYLESRDRKRLKADEEKRQRETALVHRLHNIEVQQKLMQSRLDRIG